MVCSNVVFGVFDVRVTYVEVYVEARGLWWCDCCVVVTGPQHLRKGGWVVVCGYLRYTCKTTLAA